MLFIVPGIGDALEGVDLALIVTMGRLISVAGDVGNTAFDVYSVVQDPGNAIFAVFSTLSVAKSLGKAAEAFKAVKDADIAKMGDTVNAGTSLVKKDCLACI